MSNGPLHVTLVISSLAGGGAERVLVLLAKGLGALGCRVSVVSLFGQEHDFYPLPEGVERIALDVGRTTRGFEKISANIGRLRAIRRAIGRLRPDVVVSFMTETNVLVLLAALGRRTPVVVSEHADPKKKRLGRAWKGLRRCVYRRAARVVSVSEGVDAHFAWIPAKRRAVIANPICPEEIGTRSEEPLPFDWPRTVAAMGRLEPEKGFDLLLRAFARRAADFPDWGLVILGEGSQRTRLEGLVEELGLGRRVQLPGAVAVPFPTLRRADLFVLASRSEGFGNVLVEAMACGVPVVATDCWHTSPGIVKPGVDGIVVPPGDVDALARAMAELMGSDTRRRDFAEKGIESAKRFYLDRISGAWLELIEAVVGKR